jgi:hypothetical protein
MSVKEPTNFEEFWPEYVRAHQNKTNRNLHALGTMAALAWAAICVLRGKPRLLLLSFVLGYGPAWMGHFVFEKNRPATFQHPLWSFRGDFRMLALILQGKMDDEVARYANTDSDEQAQSDYRMPYS